MIKQAFLATLKMFRDAEIAVSQSLMFEMEKKEEKTIKTSWNRERF